MSINRGYVLPEEERQSERLRNGYHSGTSPSGLRSHPPMRSLTRFGFARKRASRARLMRKGIICSSTYMSFLNTY
nr:MAG TPA: hypothetical protein [Crassvirales sp.]